MTVSEVCKIMYDCDRLRDVLLQYKQKLTDSDVMEIRDLLWRYKSELLDKELKDQKRKK